MCYAFAVSFVIVGVVGFFLCVWKDYPIPAAASAIATALFWPALSYATEIRRQNMAIRLMEVPLSLAKNEQSAAKALEQFFRSTFKKGGK